MLSGMAIGALSALSFSVFAERPVLPAPPTPSAQTGLPDDEARLLAEVIERVKGEYVEKVEDRDLMQHALRGVVSGLDPYSAFLDKTEYDEIRESTSGTYPGVGIEVSADRGGIKVVRTLENSPAERADLRAGDLIVRIDSAPVGADLDAAIDRMRGSPGTEVQLTVKRPGTPQVLDLGTICHELKPRGRLEAGFIRG